MSAVNKVTSLLFLFFLVISNHFSLAAEDLPAIIKKIQPSTVVIFCYDEKGKITGQATGFFLNKKGEIITNYHVFSKADYIKVKTIDGETYPMKYILAFDRAGDLARISLDELPNNIYPLQLNTSIPEVGENIVVIGNPMGYEYTASEGIVSAVREIESVGRLIQISAPISPGSSGSPVVNMRGEVIGIATYGMVEGQNLNFAIPSERIRKLVTIENQPTYDKLVGEIRKTIPEKNYFYDKGFELMVAEDYEGAIYYFQEALKDNPDEFTYSYIGFCNRQSGRLDEALIAYKQAIRLNPKDVMNLSEIGSTCFEMRNEKEAIIYLRKAIDLDPTGEVIDWYPFINLGTIYLENRQYVEAIKLLKQAIKIDPVAGGGYFKLGNCYYALGHYNEAIDAYKRAITLNPSDVDAHYNLGVAYLVINDKDSALRECKILTKLDEELANELFQQIKNRL